MTDLLQVYTTLPNKVQANELARVLVEAGRAACVQVLGPLESTYRWEGKLEQSQEWMLVAKTTVTGYPALEAAIRQSHPYQVPEILALPVATGNPSYLNWVRQAVRQTT